MILTIISWLTLGIFIGMALAVLVVGLYGDSQLNEQIRELRKARHDMQIAKTKYQLAHTLNWWKKK